MNGCFGIHCDRALLPLGQHMCCHQVLACLPPVVHKQLGPCTNVANGHVLLDRCVLWPKRVWLSFTVASVRRNSTAVVCGRACVPAVTELEERWCIWSACPSEGKYGGILAGWDVSKSRDVGSLFRCKNDGRNASDKNWSHPITLVPAILVTPGNQSDLHRSLLSLQSQVARGLDQRYSGPDLLYTGEKRVQV